jgi:hypothetical protein
VAADCLGWKRERKELSKESETKRQRINGRKIRER